MVRAAVIIVLAVAVSSATEQYRVTLTGGPSHDGRYLSFADPATGNLIVRENSTSTFRRLTNRLSSSREFAYFSAVSRDASKVAYAWFNDEGFYDLRVVNIDGSGERILYRNEQAGFVQPCAWSADGNQILTLFFRKDNISQIALVPADGGPPRVLRSLNWVYPKRMDLSPDGRYIVYDSFANAEGGDRTIFLLSVDGTKETKLVDRPGNHLFPLWTPHGDSVVYVTEQDVMSLRVENGRTIGSPTRIFSTPGRILPMGITQDGSYYYGVRSGAVDVFVTDFENPAANAKRLSLQFPGRNTAPAWSPDGRSVAFLSRRGTENFGQESRTIVIRSFEPDAEREVPVKLAHIERVRWSYDGCALLVSGSDNKGRAGLFGVDLETGKLTGLAVEAGAAFRGFEGVLSKAGLFHVDGEELRGPEGVLFRGKELRSVTVSPNGSRLALSAGTDVLILGLDGEVIRRIPLGGVDQLDWGTRLVASSGAELWEIPVEGGTPRKLPAPGNRQPGFSLHPDGKRIAVTAGRITSEVRVQKLDLK